MNHKLILVKSITLLYRESQITGIKEKSNELVRTIIGTIKLSEANLGVNQERDVLENLRATALAMCDDPIDHVYEPVDLLQRLKIDTGDDTATYDGLKEAICAEMSEPAIKRTCISIKKTLHNYYREGQAIDIFTKAANQLRFNRESIKDLKTFITEHIQSLEPYQMDVATKDPAIISEVDLTDTETVSNVFREVKTMDDGSGTLKTGWQCINRMTRGGFRRGEEVLISALQHNFKTGFTLCLFSHLALFNEPYMIDPTKKPLLLRISFEDDVTLNMQFLYTYLKENETGVKIESLEGIDEKEMSDYVNKKLMANNYHVKLLKVNPGLWSYSHICNKILEYEAQGYELHAVMLDYLYLVPTTGCSQGPAGHDVRDLFRRMRNFTNPRRITLITPHQISTDGKKLVREGATVDFVKDIANKGYYAGSSQIDQEVDLEIYIHIVKFNGYSWLTMQRGKHRIPGITKAEDLYAVMRFESIGTMPYDVNGPDLSVRKVGATPGGGEDGKAGVFWDD